MIACVKCTTNLELLWRQKEILDVIMCEESRAREETDCDSPTVPLPSVRREKEKLILQLSDISIFPQNTHSHGKGSKNHLLGTISVCWRWRDAVRSCCRATALAMIRHKKSQSTEITCHGGSRYSREIDNKKNKTFSHNFFFLSRKKTHWHNFSN